MGTHFMVGTVLDFMYTVLEKIKSPAILLYCLHRKTYNIMYIVMIDTKEKNEVI